MYNPQLETFIRVADAGSFKKAAEESYITPTVQRFLDAAKELRKELYILIAPPTAPLRGTPPAWSPFETRWWGFAAPR